MDILDGFGVVVVCEEGCWCCFLMGFKVLISLWVVEMELCELCSVGVVFGLFDVDDEFFVIVCLVFLGIWLLLFDVIVVLDYDIVVEVLDNLDVEIDFEDFEDVDLFEEGDLGLLFDIGLFEVVLGVIFDEIDFYVDE